jgi:tyrosine-protein kinase Etk/Wzc
MQAETSQLHPDAQPPLGNIVVPEDAAGGARYGELDLFAFLLLLLRNLKLIVGCGVVAFLVMVAAMLHAKPRYASTAVMIIPQGNITSASLEAKISANTLDLLGGGFELYADILKSRTIADRIIKNHDLMHVYGVTRIQHAEAQLANLTKVETSREGVLKVTTEDTDPQRAADISNDYLHQLDILNSSLVLSSVSEERAYLEREMVKEKDALADAEVALKQVQESTSGLPPDAVANASLNALQMTRAQLRADQIQLAALLTGETEQNPEVIRLRSEVAGLSGQLQNLEKGEASTANGTPTSKVPEETLEYTRRLRDVKFHETLFELLEKEFDAAKSQEAKTPTIVQVLDSAVPSPEKSWPPRTYYCLAAAVLGTLLGIFLVSLRALVQAYVGAPQNRVKLQELKQTVRSIVPRRS